MAGLTNQAAKKLALFLSFLLIIVLAVESRQIAGKFACFKS